MGHANDNTYWAGRNAGWDRADSTRDGGAAHGPVPPANASSDYMQGYQDGVELNVSGFTSEGDRVILR